MLADFGKAKVLLIQQISFHLGCDLDQSTLRSVAEGKLSAYECIKNVKIRQDNIAKWKKILRWILPR